MVNSKMNVKIDVFAALFEFVVTLQKTFESSEKKLKKQNSEIKKKSNHQKRKTTFQCL